MENEVAEDIENGQAIRWAGYNAESLEALCKDREPKRLSGGHDARLAAALESSPADGVDPTSVDARRAVFGANEYLHAPGANYLQLVWEQLKDPMILLLIAAASVSTVLGASLPEQREERAYIDGIAIWLAVLVVVSVGAGNDYHKELQFRKLNAAKDVLNTKVVRGGQRLVVQSSELVVGDIVLLDTGDKVAADGILVEPYRSLCMDESSLTGESDVVHKSKERPFIISGTQVAEGEGRMLVLAVGPRTEWGRLIALTTGEMDNTPLQDKLTHVAALVAKIGLSVAIICFVVLFIFLCVEVHGFPTTSSQWMEVLDYFLYAVTIIVVAVPEGLPLAVTISLAYSMRKMMKDNNFVRHLAACETMGGATTICTDKTGTLTQNRMTVVEAWLAGAVISRPPTLSDLPCKAVTQLLCDGISTNSKAFLMEQEGNVELVGNRTECALLLMLRSWGVDGVQIREGCCIEAVGNFTAERKMSSVLVRQQHTFGQPAEATRDSPGPLCLHVKGAAEIVVSRCEGYMDSKGVHCGFNDSPCEAGGQLHALEDRITDMASRGLRTLAIAVRSGLIDETALAGKPITDLEEKLTLVAIVGIKDPVRPAVPDTIQVCYGAGIDVKMVTGDNLYTARHIADECGLLTSDGITLDGPTFRAMPDNEVIPLLPKLEVLARSSPEDKFRLVSLLRQQKEVVAVTGDGTNDAPALKEADVGLSMGIAGTDVAKEASDIVILDDNFGSIVKAVMWGRSIFGNIRKFLQFQLTVNLVALAIAFLAAVTGRGEPLNVLQLLWVNLIMDSLAALALATEDPTPDLLKEKPHGRHEALITNFMKHHILLQSAYQVGWLMFLLYGLPRLDLARYADPCTIPCDEWYPQQQQLLQLGEAEAAQCIVGTAVSDPDAPGCSNQAAIHDYNQKVGAAQEQAIRSLLFNTFIFMQVFNEVNSRKLWGELDTISGIHKNHVFVAVLTVTVAMQVVIMETPLANFFKVSPQSWQEWLFAVAVGAGSMLVCLLGKLGRRAVITALGRMGGGLSRRGGAAGRAGDAEAAASTTTSGRWQIAPVEQQGSLGGAPPVSQELAEVFVTLRVGESDAGKLGAVCNEASL